MKTILYEYFRLLKSILFKSHDFNLLFSLLLLYTNIDLKKIFTILIKKLYYKQFKNLLSILFSERPNSYHKDSKKLLMLSVIVCTVRIVLEQRHFRGLKKNETLITIGGDILVGVIKFDPFEIKKIFSRWMPNYPKKLTLPQKYVKMSNNISNLQFLTKISP